MGHETTTFESDSSGERSAGGHAAGEALVVVWSREAQRLGEVLFVPGEGERRAFVFGRGTSADGRRERLRLVRQRPGATVETEPLESASLSRVQLVIRRHAEGGLEIENAGKRALLLGGRVVASGRVRPGELVEIGDQLVFLCVRRPAVLPALRASDRRLSPTFGEADAFGYVGESAEAWRLRDELALVGRRAEHILVLGESGVGKELAAQAIHALSARAGRKIVARNAATVPAGIIDAELFGNSANYPNAGMAERHGLVGEADGGTLYLDEIGEISTELQTHFLRLLDSGEYQRLGDPRRRTADLRLIAATNRPVGQLRADLVARFAIRLAAPGLHERREDVPLLARHVLRKIAAGDTGGSPPPPRGALTLSKELAVALVQHAYTTHVRELTNVIFRARMESYWQEDGLVQLTAGAREMLGLGGGSAMGGSNGAPPRETITREALVEALARHEGVREKVWRDLGLSNRYVLKRLLQKYGIQDDES
jgi:two-component system nitrogen regulation response regulator GlnG/two-component system response regulator HydG